MATQIEARIDELRGKQDDLDRAELAGLYFLRQVTGVETEEEIRNLINYKDTDPNDPTAPTRTSRWEVWAAESIVWTARRLRMRERELRLGGSPYDAAQATREALRGWGQVREYRGANGGYLPIGIADHATALQNRLESIIAPR